MEEKILVPLDGSEVGEAALPVIKTLVTRLSPQVKVEITLLQVIAHATHWIATAEGSAPVVYTESELEQIKKQATEYLEKAAEPLRKKGATVKTAVAVGHPADEILAAAEATGANLIAMSTHGRSGISRWAFGSVTEKVLQAGHTPIMTVRAPAKV